MATKKPEQTRAAADLPPGEPEDYDQYLQNILSEFGLQLESDGSHITEMEVTPLSFEELRETEEEEEEELKPMVAGTSTSTSEEHKGGEEVRSATATSSSAPGDDPPKKKLRKYEMKPLENPVMERKRVMAVVAKRYRDKQKRQMREMENEVAKKDRIISQCTKVIRRTNQDRKKLETKLNRSDEQRLQLEEQIKKKEEGVRDMRETLALFCGHLDIIAGSLDDDNPAKRLILSLLQRLPRRVSFQTPTAVDPSSTSSRDEPVVKPDVSPTS